MTGANVQTWDDVAELPWHEGFEMSTPPEPVAADPPRRRRADARSLADVVAAIAFECAA